MAVVKNAPTIGGLTMHRWEVKKDGETKCYGDSLQSFPSDYLIAKLRLAGYKIYVDGKLHAKKKGF